jgi:hypothetical protein
VAQFEEADGSGVKEHVEQGGCYSTRRFEQGLELESDFTKHDEDCVDEHSRWHLQEAPLEEVHTQMFGGGIFPDTVSHRPDLSPKSGKVLLSALASASAQA